MKTLFRTMAATVAIAALTTAFASPASASCSYSQAQKTGASLWDSLGDPQEPSGLRPAGFLRVANLAANDPASGLRWHDEPGAEHRHASIVGLWKFTFVAKGNSNIPDGHVVDWGYATWHSDGTEIMNSSRPPITSSFCMGVWKQTAQNSFKLNHVALSWDTTGTVFVGPANIRERVTVNRAGNRYAGTFTIKQFSMDGTTVLAHVTGTISATRITTD